jgi:hypothetical protein
MAIFILKEWDKMNMAETKRYEQCVYEDLPVEKVTEFILRSEQNNQKLEYKARPPKSGKKDHMDIWSCLKSGEDP